MVTEENLGLVSVGMTWDVLGGTFQRNFGWRACTTTLDAPRRQRTLRLAQLPGGSVPEITA